MIAEQLTPPICEHGEGIATHPGWSGPRWVDMLAGDILELEPSGEVRRRHVGQVAAMTRPRRAGGWIVALERRIAVADGDDVDAPIELGPELWADARVRSNEGACAPDGRLYLGTMDYDATRDRGFVLEVGHADAPRVVVAPVTISNGLGFSPDGRSAYYVDSPLRRIDRFEWDAEAGLHRRTPWARLPDAAEGVPDGLAVDSEGGVWVALFGGSSVWRFDAAGAGEPVVSLPVRQPTAVAFDGPRLLITTSRSGLGDAAEASAGALFCVADVGVTGAPVAAFGS
jgi:sugar lactone lactonase YvrE